MNKIHDKFIIFIYIYKYKISNRLKNSTIMVFFFEKCPSNFLTMFKIDDDLKNRHLIKILKISTIIYVIFNLEFLFHIYIYLYPEHKV